MTEKISENHYLNRFFETFSSGNAELFSLKQNVFVAINSMGLDDDNCKMCRDVDGKLTKISNILSCSKKVSYLNEFKSSVFFAIAKHRLRTYIYHLYVEKLKKGNKLLYFKANLRSIKCNYQLYSSRTLSPHLYVRERSRLKLFAKKVIELYAKVVYWKNSCMLKIRMR